MRQLAKTLLILGSVAACERASDVSDTSRRAERAAQPLVILTGGPAVGNIGQAGRPAASIPVIRAQSITPSDRTVANPNRPQRPRPRARPNPPPLPPDSSDLQLQTEQVNAPMLNREGRPATGNVERRTAGPPYDERMERARLANGRAGDAP